jgi:hypothetical protein
MIFLYSSMTSLFCSFLASILFRNNWIPEGLHSSLAKDHQKVDNFLLNHHHSENGQQIAWGASLFNYFHLQVRRLAPNSSEIVPRCGSQAHSVAGHCNLRYSVVVSAQITCQLNKNQSENLSLKFEWNLPLCSPLRTSQMWMVESSDPAKRARPEGETAHEVRPELVVGGRNTNTC